MRQMQRSRDHQRTLHACFQLEASAAFCHRHRSPLLDCDCPHPVQSRRA
jgi:hypothetical protein